MNHFDVLKLTNTGLDGTVRRCAKKRISIFDIIGVVGGQKNPRHTWSDIKSGKYTDAANLVRLLSYCSEYKFSTALGGQKSPVIDIAGVPHLLNIIPGSKARIFRLGGYEKFINILSNDENIVTDLPFADDPLVTEKKESLVESCALGKKIALTLNSIKSRNVYDESYILYIRGMKKPFENITKIINRCDSKNIYYFDTNLIKFGICNDLDKRNEAYGDDNGFFYYSLKFDKKADARKIETIFRKRYKKIMYKKSLEYIDTRELLTSLNDCEEFNTIDWDQYCLLLRKLFCSVLKESHRFFPEMQSSSNSYGFKYDLDMNAPGNSVCKITLQKDNFPEYDI